MIVAAVSGCVLGAKPEGTAGRWIRFDPATQRYSVEAEQVPRGALLDELKMVAKADVRPQLERDALVAAKGIDLDLDALIALLLPRDARPTVRRGERELPAGTPSTINARKEGPPLLSIPEAVTKPDPASEYDPELKRSGTLKRAAEHAFEPREISGPRTKPQATTLLYAAETTEPKKRLPRPVETATVRLTLQFEEGVAPRVIHVQEIEGRVPVQRFVTGTYLYALIGGNGQVLNAGTFQDPLVEHSYLPDGTHSSGHTKSGVAAISIPREYLSAARLQIVDVTGLSMPRELDEQVVLGALERGHTSLQLETRNILHRLEQKVKQ
jgi:hypothetical protein